MKPSNPSLVAAYRKANPVCELSSFTMIPPPFRCRTPSQIHHIFSVRRRWDLLSVIIHLSEVKHQWCHLHPVEGRILCLLVKARKGELDRGEIYKASGMYLEGWFGMKKGECRLEWMAPYVAELGCFLE